MDKKKVYVIEDDKHISELMVYKLESAGFDAEAYYDGESGLKAIMSASPDVVLLDLMLPGIDGYEICRKVRANKETENIIIIMLTARGEEGDKVLGLEIGADDYIVKPFSVREVVARVRAVLRRINRISKAAEDEIIKIGDIKIIPDKREAFRGSELLELKTKEYDLLYYLMRNAGRALSRKQLLDDIWGYDYYGETRTVDVHISQLRLKIESNPETPKYIKTLRSVGYKFADKTKEDD
jgi:two-component system alkaline phosphatase synthesis response regulator PhoP